MKPLSQSFLLGPAGISTLPAIALWLLHYPNAAYSLWLGALACLLSIVYFYAQVLGKRYPNVGPETILRTFYKAEIKKLLINGVVFFACFKWLSVLPLPFLLGWIMTQVLFFVWLSAWK